MDKYRVWHTEWEEFVTDYPICMNVLTGKIVKFDYGEYSDEEDIEDTKYILSKYTGLKDKNDVEIFEGDIVDVYTLEESIYLRGVVKKVKGGFYIEGLYRSKIIPLTDFYFKSYTNTLQIGVLGNKYEISNLLEG